jgi:hypothetical protein
LATTASPWPVITAGAQIITESAPLTNLTVNGGSGDNQLTVSALTMPVQSVTLVGGGGTNTYTVSAGTVNIVAGTGDNILAVTGGTVASITAPAGVSVPLVFADSYTVLDNGVLTVPAGSGVLANDLATVTGGLTAVLRQGPSHGTLTFRADGSFTYTPAADYVGSDAFTYQAEGSDGSLSAVATVTVQVTYGFSGFLPPLDSSLAFGLGRTIPIKFQLRDANGNLITSLAAVTALQVQALDAHGNPLGAPFSPTAAGGTALRNDGGQYVFNWQTKGLATGSYTLLLKLADGTTKAKTIQLSANGGAFQLAAGATSDYVSSTANQILYGTLTVAVQDDTGAGIDASELDRVNDALSYLNAALGSFGVNLTWAAPGTAADVHIHFASSTPYGGASAGVMGFTTAENDVYLVSGWDFYTGTDPTQLGAGQYDFLTLATHELAHTVGLGESSDPASVMYEYLAPGTVRRTFTDGNLTAINSDADRFMKVQPNPGGASAAAAGQTPSGALQRLAALMPAVERAGGAGMPPLPGRLSPTSKSLGATAANPLAGPVALAPASVHVTAVGQALPDQRDHLLQGGSDRNVLIGGAGTELIFGGQVRDVLVGGFDHYQAESAWDGEVVMAGRADLDAHAEAVRQVAAERSAAGSLTGLNDRGAVAGTSGLSEQAEVDVWSSVRNNPDGFLLDEPAQQDTL